MNQRHLLPWGLLLASTACLGQTAAEDEAWIERYVAAQPAALPEQQIDETRIVAFTGLSGLRGAPLAVTLRDGRVRRGLLQRADRSSLVLEQSLNGGRFAFTVQRGDVARIVREDG